MQKIPFHSYPRSNSKCLCCLYLDLLFNVVMCRLSRNRQKIQARRKKQDKFSSFRASFSLFTHQSARRSHGFWAQKIQNASRPRFSRLFLTSTSSRWCREGGNNKAVFPSKKEKRVLLPLSFTLSFSSCVPCSMEQHSVEHWNRNGTLRRKGGRASRRVWREERGISTVSKKRGTDKAARERRRISKERERDRSFLVSLSSP